MEHRYGFWRTLLTTAKGETRGVFRGTVPENVEAHRRANPTSCDEASARASGGCKKLLLNIAYNSSRTWYFQADSDPRPIFSGSCGCGMALLLGLPIPMRKACKFYLQHSRKHSSKSDEQVSLTREKATCCGSRHSYGQSSGPQSRDCCV